MFRLHSLGNFLNMRKNFPDGNADVPTTFLGLCYQGSIVVQLNINHWVSSFGSLWLRINIDFLAISKTIEFFISQIPLPPTSLEAKGRFWTLTSCPVIGNQVSIVDCFLIEHQALPDKVLPVILGTKHRARSSIVEHRQPCLGFPRPPKKPLVRDDPTIFTLPKNSNPF